MRDCCRNDWTGQNVRFLIVASYHQVHICARLANSTAARRREGQGALMRRRMSLTILGVSPAWHKVLPAEERVERKQTERVAHIACMQNPGWISRAAQDIQFPEHMAWPTGLMPGRTR